MLGVWKALVRNATIRTSETMGNIWGGDKQASKGGYAPNQRGRGSKLEDRKPKASRQKATSNPSTIPDLLRAIEGIGCRVIQIDKLAWQIESSEASRGSCLLVGRYGGHKQKPSRYAVGSSRMGRSKKASRRSRNGTRSVRGSNQSASENGRGARSVRQMAGSN